MKQIHTEIEIDASPEKVWQILTEFEKYPEWNPFVREISGDKKKGGKLNVLLQQVESKPMRFKPTILEFNENKELRWLGHLIIPGVFDGEHCFKLVEREGGKTKLVQSEKFKGFLVGMMWKQLNTKTVKSFELMNAAVKERAES